MDSLIHADIFFFVTTIALVLVTLVILVAGFYIVRIVRDVYQIISLIKAEGDNLSEDIAILRMRVKEKGEKVASMGTGAVASALVSFVFAFISAFSKQTGFKRKRKG